MSDYILQDRLPEAPWHDPSFRRLPGMRAIGPDDWVTVDGVYAEQMRLREDLLETRRADVLAILPEAREAAVEVLEVTLEVLSKRADFEVGAGMVRRPDGTVVAVSEADPLGTVGRLIQEDVCILQKQGEEHVLTGAALLFPSGWTLAQKLGKPLLRIHRPVPDYDGDVGRRVQRLFDGLKVGRPLMRSNLLWHGEPMLFAPRTEENPRPPAAEMPPYVRSERQCLVRLPRTEAVIFTIHTTVIETAAIPPEERAALRRRPD